MDWMIVSQENIKLVFFYNLLVNNFKLKINHIFRPHHGNVYYLKNFQLLAII